MLERSELWTPYPTVPLSPHDFGTVYPDADCVTCHCGNEAAWEGFAGMARSTGRFAWLGHGVNPHGMAVLDPFEDDPNLAVCHVCGRVYDDADLTRGVAASFPVFQLDMSHPAVLAAQRAYWDQNGFGGW